MYCNTVLSRFRLTQGHSATACAMRSGHQIANVTNLPCGGHASRDKDHDVKHANMGQSKRQRFRSTSSRSCDRPRLCGSQWQ
eukprot:2011616-Prymnesium_polylepis.1